MSNDLVLGNVTTPCQDKMKSTAKINYINIYLLDDMLIIYQHWYFITNKGPNKHK